MIVMCRCPFDLQMKFADMTHVWGCAGRACALCWVGGHSWGGSASTASFRLGMRVCQRGSARGDRIEELPQPLHIIDVCVSS